MQLRYEGEIYDVECCCKPFCLKCGRFMREEDNWIKCILPIGALFLFVFIGLMLLLGSEVLMCIMLMLVVTVEGRRVLLC